MNDYTAAEFPHYLILIGSLSVSQGHAAVSGLEATTGSSCTISRLPPKITSDASTVVVAETISAAHGHFDALINNTNVLFCSFVDRSIRSIAPK